MRLSLLTTVLACLAAPVAWGQAQDDVDRHAGAHAAPAGPQARREPVHHEPDASPPSAGMPTSAAACPRDEKIAINPSAAPLHVGLKTYPRTLSLPDRTVVLTFDDGPARETTPAILDALREACVHATFFLIGRHAAEHPDLARREMEEGHSTGHHSQSHPAFTLRGFDTASAEHDIVSGIAADERAIFDEAAAPDHPHVPFFRFPGFADTPELLAFLDRRKIAVFGADMWAADWLDMSPKHERERVLGLLEKAPHHNGILLFHDTRPSTAQMLPGLLAELRAKGYKVAHLVNDPKAPTPALTMAPKGWSSETERIIAHLRRPIVPGAHHGAGTDEPVVPGEGMGEAPTDPPR